MRLTPVVPDPPPALRVLVQGDDDAAPIEFALDVAAAWTDLPLLVVNATGRDLAAFGGRYKLVEIRDDENRPTRSLTEIIGVLEQVNPGDFGAAVILDTNRIYRVTRCAVRDAKQIENLSAGQWDSTNEALGLLGEKLTRLGLPSVFYAPPTDVYGADEHGDTQVVGTKAQGWKDLPRSSHLHVRVSRSAEESVVEVAGDDWNRLGKPGTVIRGAGGRDIGSAVADLARSARAGEAGGTTLEESSAAELAARAARAAARKRKSEELRSRLLNVADLRAAQGRWGEFMDEVHESYADLEPDDLAKVTKCTDGVLAKREKMIAWQREAAADLDRHIARSLHELRPGGVVGPSILTCPARDDMPVEDLLAEPPAVAPNTIRGCSREDVPAWVASLAQYAGVWSEPEFAALSLSCGLIAAGPSWEAYSDEELRLVALACLSLAKTRRLFDGPPVSRDRPRLRAVATEPDSTTATPRASSPPSPPLDPFELPSELLAEPQPQPHVADERPDRKAVVPLPSIGEFAALPKNESADYINTLLLAHGWRDRLPVLFEAAQIQPARPQAAHLWTNPERVAAYRVLLAQSDHRMAS